MDEAPVTNRCQTPVASGILAAVKDGICAAQIKRWLTPEAGSFSARLVMRAVLSAGLEARLDVRQDACRHKGRAAWSLRRGGRLS